MANLYVWSGGSNTSPYDTWAKAATTPLTATAAAAAGDTVYQHAETFTLTASTTYTLASNVRWICTDDTTNMPPQTLSTAGVIAMDGVNSFQIYILGLGYVYGIRFAAGATSSNSSIAIAFSAGNRITLDNCTLDLSACTSASSSINYGAASASRNSVVLINSKVKFGHVDQSQGIRARLRFIGGSILASESTVPTKLFNAHTGAGGYNKHEFYGIDFSGMTSGTLFGISAGGPVNFLLNRCTLGAAALNSALTISGMEVELFDCASTDVHYQYAHYAYEGSTTISTAIYANDGAEYDIAGTKHTWVVAGNANTTRANPYVSPWISAYNEATSAITPEIEILRDGSSSAFTDIEVWSEWLLKTAGGSPLATLYSDYGGHLSSGTAQGAGSATWTGGTTPWVGKLECPSVTPAEIGHVSARVIVAGNYTVYVDPQIRGL